MSEPRGKSGLRSALAKELRSLRHRKGITQEKLAFLAGLHPTYISMLENGRKSPTIDALERIARALEANLSSIFACAERSSDGPYSDE